MMLPPMLSPTLPVQYSKLPVPLSPTLPPQYNEQMMVKLKYGLGTKRASNRSYSSSEDEPEPKVEHKPKVSRPAEPKTASRQVSREPTYELQQHDHWLNHARAKKHESDEFITSRQHQEAVVRVVDSIICFLRGFYWYDLDRKSMDKMHSARPWETMLPHLAERIAYLESVDAEIAGVCYFIRAVCGLHVAKSAKYYKMKKTPMGVNLSTVLQEAISNFSSGLMYLPYESVVNKYGINWTTNSRADKMDLKNDTCVLPLHCNSSIRDAAAFSYRIVAEWAKHENLSYKFACAEGD